MNGDTPKSEVLRLAEDRVREHLEKAVSAECDMTLVEYLPSGEPVVRALGLDGEDVPCEVRTR